MPALTVGDPAPWFVSASSIAAGQDFVMGGYRAVLCFLGSAGQPQTQAVLQNFYSARAQFVAWDIHFFAISIDPNDRGLEQSLQPCSHFHLLWDFSGEISIRYELCQMGQSSGISYDPTTFVLDENLRILNLFALETQVSHAQQVLQYLQTIPAAQATQRISQQAPVLLIPNVLSAQLCQQLIASYRQTGGAESGIMQQQGDKTVVVLQPTVKRRRDWLITEPDLLNAINLALSRRVVPEIAKVFQSRVTCFERYVVACYEAANQGFFRPHRDNTAQGNQHRRFALTLNLNNSYKGGALRFPEYSNHLYCPEPGGAAIFSCSLLHEATPVTVGERFVLLSFLYGDEDAKLRQQTQDQIIRTGVAQNLPASGRIAAKL
ncbi:MAG: 2OG-Fe(II) oxygenase [Pegethrix bostrychoides GSE-TBD4-15B]|jgi:peroxiredoxin/predicted 2-oxoglutarate/Fe(II)-dependent dioxygenase YbiX|uniref:2OG-Fe(II) oxygenase n=1 Tax=Pegethrix bostrychoides GSE-TBD4-15B TaxID=2839662 RepID=A0A951P6X4_9CYAN|nr:2OG-Fe(II) oxygenase [Pegethrix bostrychoides GSE-TBD4-15B]